jgi:hypothetical protein
MPGSAQVRRSCFFGNDIMAEITVERNGELLRNLFQILLEHPDGLRAGEALAKLRSRVKLL